LSFSKDDDAESIEREDLSAADSDERAEVSGVASVRGALPKVALPHTLEISGRLAGIAECSDCPPLPSLNAELGHGASA